MGILDENYTVKLLLSTRDKVNESNRLRIRRLPSHPLQDEERTLPEIPLHEWGIESLSDRCQLQLLKNGEDQFKGLCEVRLFDSALVILPQKNKPLRIPYCYINAVKEEDYAIKVETELSERARIGGIQPQLDTMRRSKLAGLLKDGRDAEKAEIDKITPEFWGLLESKAIWRGFARVTIKSGQRGRLGKWAFNQLRTFVEYKAKLGGVPVILVDPRD
jgi:hypothetical protein